MKQAGTVENHSKIRWWHGISSPVMGVFFFSALVNALMFTGPLFMLQVYDRVLGSGSEETLVALVLVIGFLFAMMAFLDIVRTRVMTRMAAQLQDRMAGPIFEASLRRSVILPGDFLAGSAVRDLDSVQRTIASPVALAIFDLPFVPFFLVGLFLFHPWIGWFAVAAGAVLLVLLVANQFAGWRRVTQAQRDSVVSIRMTDQFRDSGELIQGLGMRGAALERWSQSRRAAQASALAASDLSTSFSVTTRVFRLFLQSALLALGAWLVLQGELTAGAMIASSILLGRALAPIEQATSGWANVQQAHEGARRLSRLLAEDRSPATRIPLPRPASRLEVSRVTITPPGSTLSTVRELSFELIPGEALGIIGPSGAGKSTLGMALTGLWPVVAGSIRLDGASLDHYDPDVLGGLFGYLPQRVTLFDGTIAENISRLAVQPDPSAVVVAAQKAGAHQMILSLPEGYSTRMSQIGGRLSGGQIQRLGLARALYGDPAVLILDEPNANLDNEGSLALTTAIRAAKEQDRAVLIMAHRPAAIIACDRLLVMDKGVCVALGPREEILKALVRNATDIVRPAGLGSVT